MAAWPQLHAGDVGLHAGVPLGPGQRRGVAGLSGQAFPALGELDVFAFAAAGFLADAFVDLDAFAAGTMARPSLDRLMGASRVEGRSPSGLRFLRRYRLARTVEGDRLVNERLESGLVDFISFVEVDRAA